MTFLPNFDLCSSLRSGTTTELCLPACSSNILPLSDQSSCWHRADPCRRRTWQRSSHVGCRAADGQSGNEDLSAEFLRFSRPDVYKQASAHLELTWQASKRRRPKTCACCSGSGESECPWCHGTGVMMIGEQLYCSLQEGCRPCPICKRKGQIRCNDCKGTGFRASWMK